MEKYAVLGLGYVGLSLCVAVGKKHCVYGYDINTARIQQLRRCIDKNYQIDTADLMSKNITFTDKISDLASVSFYIIAVSTPALYYETPDLSPLISVVEALGPWLKKGDIIVFESTVYPGTTEEVCIPILEQLSQLSSGRDFHVGYSPERINPGDPNYRLENIPKIISAQTACALTKIKEFYLTICHEVYPVSSIKAAEAIKVLENSQRDVNIAFMNEFTQIMHALELNTFEIIEGAKTKWSFLPFKPGLVGGHCISIDPHYLAFKAKREGVYPEMLLTARHINDGITQFIIQSMLACIVKNKLNIECLDIAILGITYKENVNDIRNSLALKLIKELRKMKIEYHVHDPMNHVDTHFPLNLRLTPCLEAMNEASVVMLLVGHDDYQKMGIKKILSHFTNIKIFMDIPNLFVSEDKPTNIIYWSL